MKKADTIIAIFVNHDAAETTLRRTSFTPEVPLIRPIRCASLFMRG